MIKGSSQVSIATVKAF